jgi:hypothetical protein
MDVFVIPFPDGRYELYCEQPADVMAVDGGEPPTGLFARIKHRIAARFQAAEERRLRGQAVDEQAGWMGRLHDRMMGWMVERIADQRLLWNLRTRTAVTVAHPADMSLEQVTAVVRRELQHEYDRHRRWMIVDGVLFGATSVLLGPLFLLIPGVANLPAFYFGFRVIGHWLSSRGAAQGLHRVAWASRPCPPLGELRHLPDLDGGDRVEKLQDIAGRLRLQHLATFFERVSVRHA